MTLVEKASKRADKIPKVIITDKLWAYLDGIEMAFGSDTEHVQSKGFRVQPNTNLIERFHGTLKARTKIMRGLKKPETALQFLDGWLVHYNFFRPHEGIDGLTPAQKAGIISSKNNWLDIVQDGYKAHGEDVQIVTSYPLKTPSYPTKVRKQKRVHKAKVRRSRVRRQPVPLSLTGVRG